MSIHHTDVIAVGSARIITPDGRIPADLWVEYAKIVLLEPEPALAGVWIKRLEASMGVTDADRRELARAELMPFPGEAPPPRGHSLTALQETDEVWRKAHPYELPRRLLQTRPVDQHLEWYLVRTATRREAAAEAHLVEAGFAVYLPRLRRWNRPAYSRNRRQVENPLFVGYLFVGLFPDQALAQVEDLEGVHAVVRFAGERFPTPIRFTDPAPNPERPTIGDVLKAELDGEFDRTRRGLRKDPAPGSRVEILAGMFKGFPATFSERRENDRIEVLLMMFGRATPAVFDPEEVGGLEAGI